MSSIPTSADTASTFCATLVDEWIRCGVRRAMIAPGSRSTPLVLAIAARAELTTHIFHDERVAGFAALGVGLSTGMPAIVACSSGTAGAHLHAAVIEAHQSCVPMIVCTADRPGELRDVGAPQTIDQTHLYGQSVRWFFEPGIADETQRDTWRSLAARAVIDATTTLPGPVHLNLAFREPLLGTAGPLPEPRDGQWLIEADAVTTISAGAAARLQELLLSPRGVIIAGNGVDDPSAVHAFADRVGWPVLADPRSGCRTPAPTTVAAYDALLRNDDFAVANRPEVVLRLGEPPASKVLSQWVAASGATQIQVSPYSTWIDPEHHLNARVIARASTVLPLLNVKRAAEPAWLAGWAAGERVAQATFSQMVEEATGRTVNGALSEPGIARTVFGSIPNGTSLMVSSSMPVRDVEWYGAPRTGVVVYANRGANGIDGVVSTAIGVAIGSTARTVLLIGDIAFVHDASALTALAGRILDLTIVCVDNDGGGIFSFLPQGAQLPSERFEQLFGTPHGTDIVALAQAHGLKADTVTTYTELADALHDSGISVVVVRTDRDANVRVHDNLHAAVTAAVKAGSS